KTNAIQTAASTNPPANAATNETKISERKKSDEVAKPIEVVFVVDGDHVKMVPVKRGIYDDNYVEITNGLKEGDQVVTGPYKALNRDLQEGTKVLVNSANFVAKSN
ncbi:MAG TPA: efflux RND transporter periplasmic adaptor subunit, partial [Verrucomicrobiae bacterium]|nr:efflux RND transporter periplasmic adaptor subunit [Verrucomicrobiae bacterium]